MGKTKIHPMIFQLFLIPSTYNSNLVRPDSLIDVNQLNNYFRENLITYNVLIGAARFLRDCGINQSVNLENIEAKLSYRPSEDSRQYILGLLNTDWKSKPINELN